MDANGRKGRKGRKGANERKGCKYSNDRKGCEPAKNQQFPESLPPFEILQLNTPGRIRVFTGAPPEEWPLEELKAAAESIAEFEVTPGQTISYNDIDLVLFAFEQVGAPSFVIGFPLSAAGFRMIEDSEEDEDIGLNAMKDAIAGNSVICKYVYLPDARIFCRLCDFGADGNGADEVGKHIPKHSPSTS